jgi:hypothetical protein
MILSESEMLEALNSAHKILLVEPKFNRQYPPFGLAKIKTYLNALGKDVTYSRSILPEKYDLICITTSFTYFSNHVFATLKERGFINANTPVIMGGILASLMPELFKLPNVDVFRGYSKTLDLCKPDPEIISTCKDTWKDFSWVFTSRGCPNKCSYCTVWKIEKERWVNPKWKDQIFMDKPFINILDNNLSSIELPHLIDIVDFVTKHKKRVIIASGIDCKFVTKELAEQVAKIKFVRHGMRTAFDRIEEDGIFQKSTQMLQKAGVKAEDMFAYVLFNFNDKPQDANYRAEECFKLKVRAYPQYYRPLNTLNKDKVFVGKHWTFRLGKAFRYYWVMKSVRGGFRDMSFEEYIKSKEGRAKTKVKDGDIDVWLNNGK